MAAEVTALVYLATPIDQAKTDHEMPWQRVVAAARRVAAAVPGVIAFHPAHAFTVGGECGMHAGLEAINRHALNGAGGVVAIVPGGVPTIGVPREIEAAKQLGLPIAVVTDLTGRSFSLADVPHYELTYRGLEDAIKFVRDEAWLRAGDDSIGSRELVFHAVGHGRIPTRAHASDAGYDLYVSRDVTVEPGQFVDVHTDIRVAMPPGMWGRIVGRSSTRRRRNLLVIEGVIDAGYRGLIYTGVQNMSAEPVEVKTGERLAQFIPHVNVAGLVTTRELGRKEFDRLPHDGRGEGGFGSSGH